MAGETVQAVAGFVWGMVPALGATDPLLLGIAGTLLFGAMLAFLRELQSIYQILLAVGVYTSINTPVKNAVTDFVGDRPRLAQGTALLSTVLGTRLVQSLVNTVILVAIVAAAAFLVLTLADEQDRLL